MTTQTRDTLALFLAGLIAMGLVLGADGHLFQALGQFWGLR